MNMDLTEKQERGFDLVAKAMKKKFPFITHISIEEITVYYVWMELGVEITRFLSYYKVPPPKHHIKYGLENAKEYFDRPLTYLFPLVDSEFIDDFSNEYNAKMSSILNGLYNALPKEYQLLMNGSPIIDGEPKTLQVATYVIDVDLNGEFPVNTED